MQILRKLHNLSAAVNEHIQNIGRLGICTCRATHGVRVYKRALSSHAIWKLNMQTLHKLGWRMKFVVQHAWIEAKLTAWLDVHMGFRLQLTRQTTSPHELRLTPDVCTASAATTLL